MICLSVCLFLNWRVLSAFGARDGARGGGDAGGIRIDQEHGQKRAFVELKAAQSRVVAGFA
tara:strand:+ start:193 stop:375 length:183 start_codon:yes stop_codon:yes gene_type:complete